MEIFTGGVVPYILYKEETPEGTRQSRVLLHVCIESCNKDVTFVAFFTFLLQLQIMH